MDKKLLYGKVPPQAKDLEEAVLGAIMLQSDAYNTVSGILKPEYFYLPSHQRISKAMKRLADKNIPIDIFTVTEELAISEELDMVGGRFYVTKLTNSVVSAANTEAHCRIILQKFIHREIIRVAGEILSDAYNDGADPFELLDVAQQSFSNVTNALSFGEMTDITGALVKVINHIQELRKLKEERKHGLSVTGIPSGFSDLDNITRGWQPGDLIIIAARPSVGKTAFVLNALKNAGQFFYENGKGSVAMWSLEMIVIRLLLRVVSATSNIQLSAIQTGFLSENDMKTLFERSIKPLSRLPIFFDDSPGLTIAKLRAKARKLKSKEQLGLIIIDYLQLMTPEEKHGQNREQEISKISRSLKTLAQELQVPIIALSQLSRSVENRSNPEPQLSDLRESGAIEQDADMVLFLYPFTDSEIEEDITRKDKRRVKIAKNRDGVLDIIEIGFRGDIQLFENVSSSLPDSGSWRPVRSVLPD